MKTCRRESSARFLAGAMTAAETSAFEDHLEVCPTCRRQLETDAGGEESWESARELLVYRSHGFGEDDGSLTTAQREALDVEWLPACTASVVKSILAPSDDPAMIGRLGSYEIAGILGRGSAGIVLKGFDRALNRNVAVKVLDPSMAGVAAARQRFAREARAIAAISHEHVVPVYEVNEHVGLPFFVMEYVAGGSLERRLAADGPLDVVSVVRIGLQTALALAAAHRQGLVHRDIKPGNILLDRGTERVRVADFGLVRVANDVTCTRSGFVAGTPQYMAPEQVCAQACDGQSDLFSLGSVMYALCTGHPPFRADTVYGVMQRVVHDQPRPVREQNPTVPKWLERFVARLMAKERAARIASAEDAARILQEELIYLQNPTQAPPPRREWLKGAGPESNNGQRRILWGAAIGSAAAAAIAATIFLRGDEQFARPPRGESAGPATEASAQASSLASAADGVTTHTGRPLATPPQPPLPPLWNADGAFDAAAAAHALTDDVFSRSPSDEGAWSSRVEELRRRMAELEQEPF